MRLGNHRLCKRMLGLAIYRCGKLKHVFFVEPFCRNNRIYAKFSLSEGPRFVKKDSINIPRRLEREPLSHKEAVARGHGRRNGRDQRHRKT